MAVRAALKLSAQVEGLHIFILPLVKVEQELQTGPRYHSTHT